MGEFGRDKGDDSRNGDVGVAKFEGSDNFDSDDGKGVILGTSDLSETDSAVQRTVGKVILNGLFFAHVIWSSCLRVLDISI